MENINNDNNAIFPASDPTPVPAADPAPAVEPYHSSNFMMALMNALQNVSESQMDGQVADSEMWIYDQNLEEAVQEHWSGACQAILNDTSNYDSNDALTAKAQSQLSIDQSQMSTDVNTMDGTSRQQGSEVNTDSANLSKMVDLFSSLNTIGGYSSNIISH